MCDRLASFLNLTDIGDSNCPEEVPGDPGMASTIDLDGIDDCSRWRETCVTSLSLSLLRTPLGAISPMTLHLDTQKCSELETREVTEATS